MIFKDQYDPSFGRKSIFTICIAISLSVSILLMYIEYLPSFPWLLAYQISGDFVRRTLIAACLIIYFVRLQVTVWIFQKRFWTWLEAITISILMTFVVYAFAKIGGNNKQAVGIIEMIGVLLYVSGSYINTFSESARHVWKLKAENRGRLYTGGLFRFAMHINYCGDIILFTGFAMITHRPGAYIIPLAMTVNFIFIIIPQLDRYLEKKYGDEFRDYSKKTKKLIPLIY
jgi:protein-S-isoprenylcysteine O-methyltransferase Ste14